MGKKQPINWCRISSIHDIFSPLWSLDVDPGRTELALRLQHVPGSDPALAFALETPPGSWIGGKSSFKLPSWCLSWWLSWWLSWRLSWWLYGGYMVIIWWLYMIIWWLSWWLYGDYMVIIYDYMVIIMVIIWWLYGDYMVIIYEYMIIHGDYHVDYVYIYMCVWFMAISYSSQPQTIHRRRWLLKSILTNLFFDAS